MIALLNFSTATAMVVSATVPVCCPLTSHLLAAFMPFCLRFLETTKTVPRAPLTSLTCHLQKPVAHMRTPRLPMLGDAGLVSIRSVSQTGMSDGLTTLQTTMVFGRRFSRTNLEQIIRTRQELSTVRQLHFPIPSGTLRLGCRRLV